MPIYLRLKTAQVWSDVLVDSQLKKEQIDDTVDDRKNVGGIDDENNYITLPQNRNKFTCECVCVCVCDIQKSILQNKHAIRYLR